MYEGLKMLVPWKQLRRFALTGRKGQGRVGRWVAAGALALMPGTMMVAEKSPTPAIKLSLEALGFPGASRTFLDAGIRTCC
jgi:hypothetical protein